MQLRNFSSNILLVLFTLIGNWHDTEFLKKNLLFLFSDILKKAINQKLLFDVATATFNTATDIKGRRGKFLAHGDKGEWGCEHTNNSGIIMDFIQACDLRTNYPTL